MPAMMKGTARDAMSSAVIRERALVPFAPRNFLTEFELDRMRKASTALQPTTSARKGE